MHLHFQPELIFQRISAVYLNQTRRVVEWNFRINSILIPTRVDDRIHVTYHSMIIYNLILNDSLQSLFLKIVSKFD